MSDKRLNPRKCCSTRLASNSTSALRATMSQELLLGHEELVTRKKINKFTFAQFEDETLCNYGLYEIRYYITLSNLKYWENIFTNHIKEKKKMKCHSNQFDWKEQWQSAIARCKHQQNYYQITLWTDRHVHRYFLFRARLDRQLWKYQLQKCHWMSLNIGKLLLRLQS